MRNIPSIKSILSTAVLGAALSLGVYGGINAEAQSENFTLTSSDLASGVFENKFILNGFGCSGGNVSPAIEWRNQPAVASGIGGFTISRSRQPGLPKGPATRLIHYPHPPSGERRTFLIPAQQAQMETTVDHAHLRATSRTVIISHCTRLQ